MAKGYLRKMLYLFMVLCCLFSAVPVYAGAPEDLSAIIHMAELNHEPFNIVFGENKLAEFQQLLYTDFDPSEDQALAKTIQSLQLTEYREVTERVDYDKAIADIAFLFDYLKYGYSGYEYFGGDVIFLPLKESIELEVLQLAGNNGMRRISGKQFADILARQFSTVIVDGHFFIDDIPIFDAQALNYTYFSQELYQKDSDGFYQEQQGKKSYIAGITPESISLLKANGLEADVAASLEQGDFDGLIKPTLTAEGALAYCPVFISAVDIDAFPVPITLRADGKEEIQELEFTQMDIMGYLPDIYDKKFGQNEFYFFEALNGVQTVSMHSFYSMDGDETQLKQFAQDARLLKGEDFIILDLRGNGGGNSGYATSWLNNLLGEHPYGSGGSAFMYTNTVYETIPGEWTELKDLFEAFKANPENEFPGWAYGYSEEANESASKDWIDNDTVLFVITDRATASAAENFIAYLSPVKNVVLVGTNTYGVCTFGNVRPIYLPNSGIGITSCFNISVMPDFRQMEGKGFQPDLWVDTNNAVNYITALIHRYRQAAIE